jgi:hypothetical protein
MKIQNKSEYTLPVSIVMYLNESYPKDTSFEILRYFFYYLKENKINYLNWYLEDDNEIKVSLNNLSNKKVKYDKKINDSLIEKFCSFIEDNAHNLEIVEEVYDELFEAKSYNQFNKIFENKFKEIFEEVEEQNQDTFELNLIEESETEKQKDEEEIISNLQIFNIEEDIKPIIEQIISEKTIHKQTEYEWNGTSLRFKNPDGTWGKWVDLKGSTGKSGRGGKGLNASQIQSLIQQNIPLNFPTDYNLINKNGINYVEYKDFID